jgi:hypothetical protein
VTHFNKFGVPQGFHHEASTSTNGVGRPIAETHKHLAGSIRDAAPKHVFDPATQIPQTPNLFHHVPPEVDHRSLPHFTPTRVRGADWAASAYSVHYVGKNASGTGARGDHLPLALTLAPDRHFKTSRALPPAGKKTGVYERAARACIVHETTYPNSSDSR